MIKLMKKSHIKKCTVYFEIVYIKKYVPKRVCQEVAILRNDSSSRVKWDHGRPAPPWGHFMHRNTENGPYLVETWLIYFLFDERPDN